MTTGSGKITMYLSITHEAITIDDAILRRVFFIL